MLMEKFNKIGDTSFRVKSQTRAYSAILFWLEELSTIENKDLEFIDLPSDDEFKQWTSENGLYSYSDNDKWNRFNMYKNMLIKLKLLKIVNNKISVRDLRGICAKIRENTSEVFFNLLIENENFNNNAFKKMIEFILDNKSKEIKIENLCYAFFVFDNNETFEELYNIDNFLDKLTNEFINSSTFKSSELAIQENDYSRFKIYRKKSRNLEIIFNILNKKFNSEYIDFVFYWLTNSEIKKWFKKLYCIFYGENIKEFDELVLERINSLSYENFLYSFIYYRFDKLLNKEYKDLLLRWLHDLGIVYDHSSKSKFIYKKEVEKIVDKDLKYNSNNKIKKEYPYNIEQVMEILDFIDEKKFTEIKSKYNELKFTPNSAIAEYFINLLASIRLNINTKDFKTFSRTIVDNDLFPIFTAPGGGSDFYYYDHNNKRIISIETTIIKSFSQMTKSEIFQTAEHLENLTKKREGYYPYQYIVCYEEVLTKGEKSLQDIILPIISYYLNTDFNLFLNNFSEFKDIENI